MAGAGHHGRSELRKKSENPAYAGHYFIVFCGYGSLCTSMQTAVASSFAFSTQSGSANNRQT